MLVPIGLENFISVDDIVVIIKAGSFPAKKLRHKAEEERLLIDATGGLETRSLIVMKSYYVILCALQTGTLNQRIAGLKKRKGTSLWIRVSASKRKSK